MFRELRKRPAPPPGAPGPEEFTCFFLHHAGGSSASFLLMQRHLPSDWRLRAVELPGRGLASDDPPWRGTADAVRALAPELLREVTGPFAVFGHSMGALIGYELVRELVRGGRPPVWLGVSAMPAPDLVSTRFPDRRDLWPKERLVAFLRELGGTPEEMLADPDMVDYMVDLLRADLRIVDTYTHADGPPLDVPISVFTGTGDPLTTTPMIDGWRSRSTLPVAFHALPGGHFYLFEEPELLARHLAEDIEARRLAVQA
ncbi:thioesterase II family protein [Kitasatospora terrestris]|uniref:Alpha/beta fold hydrolase n=1 Tax=Kitasatospora terrestris TaxID=258051 RepID=A0ABP9D9S6_9ACTN